MIIQTIDFLIRVLGVLAILAGIYAIAIQVIDDRVQNSPSKIDRDLQLLEAGVITVDEARNRLRVEIANGEVVFYSVCKRCAKPIIDGDDQLSAWQAYVSHYKAYH